MSHSAEKFRRGTFWCFTSCGYRKSLDKRGGGGGVSRFSVEIFLSHSAENLNTGESFSVSLISGMEKFYAWEGYVTIF